MYKILIAEDDRELRDNLKHILKLEGFRVFAAKDGLDAFRNILLHKPDVIISDIKMPYVNGIELFKAVRENSESSLIPFIFLTADNDVDSFRTSISMGVKYYITKPFDLSFLLSTVKLVIEERYSIYPLSVQGKK